VFTQTAAPPAAALPFRAAIAGSRHPSTINHPPSLYRPSTQQVVKLKAFSKFQNTTEALAAATALVDSKLDKGALVVKGVCAAFARRFQPSSTAAGSAWCIREPPTCS